MTPEELLKTPGIPIEEDGPVFSAPWEAKAFALVVQLSERGTFQWKDWVDTFSAEIAAVEKIDYEPSRDYYVCWVRALEKLLAKQGLVTELGIQGAVAQTLETWPHPNHVAQSEPVGISKPYSQT